MKKIFLLFTIAIAAVGCKESDMNVVLREYAQGTFPTGKYKLVKADIIEELSVKDMADSLKATFEKIAIEPDFEEFTKLRNQEFKEFRHLNPTYEYDIMKGELKDASEWCTELRLITESADSLIANWDKVTKYSYEYIYDCMWYYCRQYQYFNSIEDYEGKQALATMQILKPSFDLLAELQTRNQSEFYAYLVRHLYTITDEFGVQENYTKKVLVSPEYIVLSSEDTQ